MGFRFGRFEFRFKRDADRHGPRRLLVLDFGSAMTKAVLASRSQGALEVERALELPAVNGDFQWEDADFQECLRQHDLRAEYVSSVISGRGGSVRLFSFPGRPPGAAQLRKQVEDALGGQTDVEVAWQIVSQSGEGDHAQYAVLACCLARTLVSTLAERITSGGHTPVSLVASGVAAVNLVQMHPAVVKGGPSTGFLEIGSRASFLMLFSGDDLALVRMFKTGADSVIEALVEETGLDMENANRLYHMNSLDFSDMGKSVIQPWLHQIAISLDFFERRFGKPVEELFLFGGGSESPILQDLMSERLRRPVSEWQPCREVEAVVWPDDGVNPHSFSLAVSEAMRVMMKAERTHVV